jgi:hypothetical protein
MKRIILTIKGEDILGSDGLMKIDGRYNFNSQINEIKKRNERYEKNFPHKIADGFYMVNERLQKVSGRIEF